MPPRSRRRKQHRARRLPRQFRRTRARPAFAARERVRADRTAFLQRHAEVRHAGQFRRRRLCPPMSRSFSIPVVKSVVPNWAVESVNAPGQVWDAKKARVQAVIAGYQHARGHSHCLAGRQRQDHRHAHRRRPSGWPRHRRIRFARRAATASAAARCASIPQTHLPRR